MEHLAPVHSKLSSIIVTTPQAVALADTMKCLSFTRNVNLPLLGLIENMSGYVCPCCGEISNVFSTGGGKALAEREGLGFLGVLPVDSELVELLDNEAIAAAEAEKQAEESEPAAGGDVVETTEAKEQRFALLARYQKTPTYKLFQNISKQALARLAEFDDAAK